MTNENRVQLTATFTNPDNSFVPFNGMVAQLIRLGDTAGESWKIEGTIKLTIADSPGDCTIRYYNNIIIGDGMGSTVGSVDPVSVISLGSPIGTVSLGSSGWFEVFIAFGLDGWEDGYDVDVDVDLTIKKIS
jgi:hypothetical protein